MSVDEVIRAVGYLRDPSAYPVDKSLKSKADVIQQNLKYCKNIDLDSVPVIARLIDEYLSVFGPHHLVAMDTVLDHCSDLSIAVEVMEMSNIWRTEAYDTLLDIVESDVAEVYDYAIFLGIEMNEYLSLKNNIDLNQEVLREIDSAEIKAGEVSSLLSKGTELQDIVALSKELHQKSELNVYERMLAVHEGQAKALIDGLL